MSSNEQIHCGAACFSAEGTVARLQEGLEWHLRHTLATSHLKDTERDWYYAFSRAVRDHLVGQWMNTQDIYEIRKVRRAYYFSLEFLLGRLLGNNAINMKLYDKCGEALAGSRLEWESLQELERDPGLGNGGLGRLAACFLDSLATMHLPCIGYGLRYDYGLFRQQIVNGEQIEEPDTWRHDGYPWEIKRPERAHTVCFGGSVSQFESNGKHVWRWFPVERVNGIPYDIPVVGYGGETVNNLRLWSAEACNDFDFQNFNQGAYAQAVASKVMAENLTKVLSKLDYEGLLPKTILYSLNPGDNAQLGTFLGAFQGPEVPGKIQHGSGWWFNDTKTGMIEQMTSLANLGLLGNFIGMLTDSRSFLSYTRHEYFRRIMCNLIGTWVENGEYPADMKTLGEMVQAISSNNAKRYFGV